MMFIHAYRLGCLLVRVRAAVAPPSWWSPNPVQVVFKIQQQKKRYIFELAMTYSKSNKRTG